jgi:hypothetical protein
MEEVSTTMRLVDSSLRLVLGLFMCPRETAELEVLLL